MKKERTCGNCKHCRKQADEYPCNVCCHNATDKWERITNADRIRNMDDKELAAFFFMHNKRIGSIEQALEWLQSEVEE